MSEIKYGLISKVDAKGLELAIDGAAKNFKEPEINILEIGLYAGESGNAMRQYAELKGKKTYLTGIDNNRDNEPMRFEYDRLIVGNSAEVHNQINDNSQHIVFLDACHCYNCVISDFYAYARKVKYGGFIAIHDTGKHIKQFTHFQHGDMSNPLAYISVREALNDILEIETSYYWTRSRRFGRHNWYIRYDEADYYDEAGGIVVLERC